MPGSQMSSRTTSKAVLLQQIEACFAAFDGGRAVSFVREDAGERIADSGFVVDDQNVMHVGR